MNLLRTFFRFPVSRTHRSGGQNASILGRNVTRTGEFLKRRAWLWPLLAILFMSLIGYGVRGAIEETMQENLRSQLRTLLNVETAMLNTWFHVQMSNSESLANSSEVRDLVEQLLHQKDADNSTDTASIHARLRKSIAPTMSAHDYEGYFIADVSHTIMSTSHQSILGESEIAEYTSFVTKALDGHVSVSSPFKSVVPMKNSQGVRSTREPTMYACAPIRDADFQVVAVLALQIRPEKEFTRILQIGRLGESGETYAFNSDAVMVSNSRFDKELMLLGLLVEEPGRRSLLNVLVHSPEGNIVEGYRPQKLRSELPPTRMAADAISGNSNVDVVGYRDYRGVPVVGAWTWLDDFDIGVATEVDFAEAFMPLTILRRTFLGLYILLGISAVVILSFSLVVSKMRHEAQVAAVEAQQLGQYTLDQKVGSGAMGVVYKGFHAMLRRPTAVKLLNLDFVNDDSIARFEREVQITCKLNHPATISIYDYGRTPEGVFYYAMEFLDGLDLQELVEQYGPISEARAVFLMKQMCGSLFEAHSLGLVHRDIKPANVMLNRRGGESDVVKVLDFGLVKAIDERKQSNVSNGLTGTPLYMSPEAIQTPAMVDHRSDIYALGALGYFLVTGRPVFQTEKIMELCRMQVDDTPVAPSQLADGELSPEFESAILSCLQKTPARRPQTARELLHLLERSPVASRWELEDADAWWGRHERTLEPSSDSSLFGLTQHAGNGIKPDSSGLDRTIVSDE